MSRRSELYSFEGWELDSSYTSSDSNDSQALLIEIHEFLRELGKEILSGKVLCIFLKEYITSTDLKTNEFSSHLQEVKKYVKDLDEGYQILDFHFWGVVDNKDKYRETEPLARGEVNHLKRTIQSSCPPGLILYKNYIIDKRSNPYGDTIEFIYNFMPVNNLLTNLPEGNYTAFWENGMLQVRLKTPELPYMDRLLPLLVFPRDALIPFKDFRQEKLSEGVPFFSSFGLMMDTLGNLISQVDPEIIRTMTPVEKEIRQRECLLEAENEPTYPGEYPPSFGAQFAVMGELWKEGAMPYSYGAPMEKLRQLIAELKGYVEEGEGYDWGDDLEAYREVYSTICGLIEKVKEQSEEGLPVYWYASGGKSHLVLKAQIEDPEGMKKCEIPAGYIPMYFYVESGSLWDAMKRFIETTVDSNLVSIARVLGLGISALMKLLWPMIHPFFQSVLGPLGKVASGLGKLPSWGGWVASAALDPFIASMYYLGGRSNYMQRIRAWQEESSRGVNDQSNLESNESRTAGSTAYASGAFPRSQKEQELADRLILNSSQAIIAEIERVEETKLKNHFSFAGVEVTSEMQAADTLASFKKKNRYTDERLDGSIATSLATDEALLSKTLRTFIKEGPKEGQQDPLEFIPEQYRTLYQMPGETAPQEEPVGVDMLALMGTGGEEVQQPQIDIDPEAVEVIEEEMSKEEYWQIIEQGLRDYVTG